MDVAGVFDSEGVTVHQVRVRSRRPDGGIRSKLFNLFVSYLPAFLRLFWIALKTPASVIMIANPVLAPLAIAHRLRFRSKVILDVAERPGAIAATDSLASIFSRLEPITLRTLARRDAIATVAVPSDAAVLRAAGFKEVLSLRNVPLASWRAPFAEPTDVDVLRCVVIGSVFEGRAYEILIQAMSLCSQRGARIALRVVGPGTADYLHRLRQLTVELGASDVITWQGPIESDEVSQTYLDAHVGLVLYEPDDPGNDGLSNKILECVSSGRPVLASDLPENRLFVSDNDVGWLTDVTPEAIADALIRIRSEADLLAISARCRALGDSGLTWEADFAAVARLLSQTR